MYNCNAAPWSASDERLDEIEQQSKVRETELEDLDETFFSHQVHKSVSIHREWEAHVVETIIPQLQKVPDDDEHLEFSQASADELNKLVAAPLFREGDKFKEIAPSSGSGTAFDIKFVSQVKVEIECCCITVAEGSAADGSVLGAETEELKETYPDLAKEKFADVQGALRLQILKTQQQSGAEECKVGPAHQMQAGETVKFRFNTRRLHEMYLLVSQKAFDSRLCVETAGTEGRESFPVLVDERLRETQQRLLLPVLPRGQATKRSTAVRLSDFVDTHDLGQGCNFLWF